MYTPSFLFQSRHGIWYFRYIFSRAWQKQLGRQEISRFLYPVIGIKYMNPIRVSTAVI